MIRTSCGAMRPAHVWTRRNRVEDPADHAVEVGLDGRDWFIPEGADREGVATALRQHLEEIHEAEVAGAFEDAWAEAARRGSDLLTSVRPRPILRPREPVAAGECPGLRGRDCSPLLALGELPRAYASGGIR